MVQENGPKKARVFIVGGGFAGVEAARVLARSNAQVTLIDRRNYHLFQPLLYQVATAILSPADIASPIRSVLRDVANCRVVLAKVRGIDLQRKRLLFERVAVEYDWLILAAGATHSYFGKDEEWSALAPGLKTIEDATLIRRRILLAFESAEYEGNEDQRKSALTFAIVGGGPTGVELAGAIKEVAAQTLPDDFRYIDTKSARVILLQGGDRLLPGFPERSSRRAKESLEQMGVEVRLKARVTNLSVDGIWIGEEFLPVRNVFWAAGVQANPVSQSLKVPLDGAGRVIVRPDLSVEGHPEVFVVGDMAAATSAKDGQPVPGVAQAAVQMGRYAAKIIAAEIAQNGGTLRRAPFSYVNKGMMATIGHSRAVAAIGRFQFSGVFAWFLWGAIHIFFLIGFRNRFAVLGRWLWNWLVYARDARLITGDARLDIKRPRPGELIMEQLEAATPIVATPIASEPEVQVRHLGA